MSAAFNINEVSGIEYCITHHGILVEGCEEECQYEEAEKAPGSVCVGVALFHKVGRS